MPRSASGWWRSARRSTISGMRIIDFHNHYYPRDYIDALASSASSVRVTYDDDGNPCVHYPGDYNILVPGHRDMDYRERGPGGGASCTLAPPALPLHAQRCQHT